MDDTAMSVFTEACTQRTPMGLLPEEVNTSDSEQMLALLCKEKHQLLEGMAVENIAEQFIRELEKSDGLQMLDVVTFITKGVPESYSNATPNQYCTFLWHRDDSDISDLILVFQTMAEGCQKTTFICREKGRKFWLTQPAKKGFRPLQHYLCEKRAMTPEDIRFPSISQDVKDEKRQISTIMGRLEPAFRDRLEPDVVLPRIFKNYLIQPFFRSGWDLDRLFRYQGQLWEFELKHKFPIDNYSFYEEEVQNTEHRLCLPFGINEGQARLIEMLANQGLQTLHLILVKPRWTDEEDPGYLYVDEEARRKTLVVGTVLSLDKINQVLRGKRKKSPRKTSYTGSDDLYYYQIPRTFFQVIGSYADGSTSLAQNIKALLDGRLNNPLTAKMLLDNCLERRYKDQER